MSNVELEKVVRTLLTSLQGHLTALKALEEMISINHANIAKLQRRVFQLEETRKS